MSRYKETAVISEQQEISPGIFSLWLETKEIAGEAKAGQFLSLYSGDESRLLPRPISICEIDREGNAVRLVYRVAGKGTQEFSGKRPGEFLDVVGPLGNGFPLLPKKAFVIGGGIGIPPMMQLARELDGEKQIVLGYRDGDLFLKEEMEALDDSKIVELYLGGGDLCMRPHPYAAGYKGICQRAGNGVLSLPGGAYGLRHRSLSGVCLQIHGCRSPHLCKE